MSTERAEARLGGAPPSTAALRGEVERLKRELAEAHAKIAELEQRADVDPLLDVRLRARAHALACLRQTLRHAGGVGLSRLDGFKAINDQHGHAAGDALLKAVAREFTTHVRASDVVGRLGGNEFGVLMWNVSGPQAGVRARELENRIEWLSLAQGPARLGVGASAGVVPLSPELDAAAMIDAADRAMYVRKKERRP